MASEIVAYAIVVEGEVQGVSFRANLKRKADENGVSGWVKNLQNGSVEAILQGAASAADRVIQWCYEGPPSARVERVILSKIDIQINLDGFRIIR